jgi:hypothetical protein
MADRGEAALASKEPHNMTVQSLPLGRSAMASMQQSLAQRAQSLAKRIDALAGLRTLVGLPTEADVPARQWRAIESLFGGVQNKLRDRLREATSTLLARAHEALAARQLNARMGEIELELARAYSAFDLYADVLTQRHASGLGQLLSGCDVLARAAMCRPHPALATLTPPLVYCDRGFGASIIREGVPLAREYRNAVPLIQIPYSRLNSEKYNLSSILHEAGHQVLVQLGLLPELRSLLRRAVSGSELQRLFSLWALEIGPDFWTFGLCGMAQAASIREIVALPRAQVMQVSSHDPHPPPYLRVLLAFEWCRQQWGRGPWDAWERDWLSLYPPGAANDQVPVLQRGRKALPTIANALLEMRPRALGGRPITALFDLPLLDPQRLQARAARAKDGVIELAGLPPGVQLAVFRAVRDAGAVGETEVDRVMSRWLCRLGTTASESDRGAAKPGASPRLHLAHSSTRRIAVGAAVGHG